MRELSRMNWERQEKSVRSARLSLSRTKWSDTGSLDSFAKREIPRAGKKSSARAEIELDPESFADRFDNRMSREKGGKPTCENYSTRVLASICPSSSSASAFTSK